MGDCLAVPGGGLGCADDQHHPLLQFQRSAVESKAAFARDYSGIDNFWHRLGLFGIFPDDSCLLIRGDRSGVASGALYPEPSVAESGCTISLWRSEILTTN